MSKFTWSDDVPVIGSLSFDEVMQKLRDMGNTEAAAELEEAYNRVSSERGVLGKTEKGNEWWQFWNAPWSPTGHSLGYLEPTNADSALQTLQHASNILPDTKLKNARIKITLDSFYVASYPGLGTHRILLKFYTRNQMKDKPEPLHFNIFCNARQGDRASVHGVPIFQGLHVGPEGIVLGVSTINVQSSGDEKLLSFLKGDLFKEGLKLLTTVQPATALFSSTMQHLTEQVANRHANAKVQELEVGLDFSKITSRYHLKEGSYIAIQFREEGHDIWIWDDWIYQKQSGLVVNKNNTKKRIPYNYLVFGISKYVDK